MAIRNTHRALESNGSGGGGASSISCNIHTCIMLLLCIGVELREGGNEGASADSFRDWLAESIACLMKLYTLTR